MNYTIISVESRKGGVGKTTAALNLSNILIEKGYNILLLDVDITGTSIAGSYNSSFWKEKINPIKLNDKDANLLEIFHNTFMKGEGLPIFSINDDKGDFYIVRKKINIFNSEIYNDDNNNSSLICDPRILFDELHSFWLIEMIESLCNSFYETINNTDNKKVAIILDNSPGYVGLGKAIHDWLTDIGPQYGKFLTVSSLDCQDLKSCISAIQAIDNMVKQKIKGAEYYNSLKNNKDTELPKGSKESKNFFLKLATKESKNEKYKYYNESLANKLELNQYQSLIINKSPKEIKSDNLYYDISKLLGADAKKMNILQTFTGTTIDNNTKNIVYYDTYIHFQFVEPLIRKININNDRKYPYLKGTFTRIVKENIINNQSLDEQYRHSLKNKNAPFEFINIIEYYEKTLSNLLDKLENNGFENIVRLIEERWHPLSQFNKMKQAFDNLLGEIFYIGDFSKYSEDHYNDYSENEIRSIIEESISSIINKKVNTDEVFRNYHYIETILYFLLSQNQIISKSEMKFSLIPSIFQFTLQLQFERFQLKYHGNINKRNREYKVFLANENLYSMEYIENMYLFENIIYEQKDSLDKERISYLSKSEHYFTFYNLFCHSQARLIDLNNDFMFLITLLRRVSVDEKGDEDIIFPNIRDILDEVIIYKSKSAEDAKEEINIELKKAQDMTIFRKVLTESVINKWGL